MTSLKNTSKKNHKSSKKPLRKTSKTTKSIKISRKTILQKNVMMHYSNSAEVFKNSMQRKLMKTFLKENKKNNLISKYPFVEITSCIFAEFSNVNIKLVNAISKKPDTFFENTKKAVGKYYKDINPVDLYITSIICASAYKNDVLIGLMVTMLNDKNIDGTMIRNILETLLSGYIPNLGVTYGGNDWKKIIYSLIFVAQIIYFLLQCNHMYYSTKNLIHEMKEGKTVSLIHTLKDISQNSEILQKCIQYNEVHPKSSSGKFVQMIFSGMGNEVYDKISGISAVYNCIEDPQIAMEVGKEASWMRSVNIDSENEIVVEEIIEEKNIFPVVESNYGTMSVIDNPLVEIGKDIEYVNELTAQQKEVMSNGLTTIFKNVETKKTYKELLDYFDDLVEPENDDLAKKLLDNDDFLKYKVQEDERKKRFKEMTGIVIKDSTYIGMIGVITGAVKEVFWSSYSHAPLLDVINSIRTKINEYVRTIREKYNAYTYLIEDVTNELSTLSTKTEIAATQLFKIVATGSALGFQIICISFYGLNKMLGKKRRSSLLAITDGNSRSIKNE